MRFSIAVLFLILCLQSLTKADDISDFEIEGVSIGDSGLIYATKKELDEKKKDWFKDKKVNDAITVKVISSDNKGLFVKPEGCDIEILIKKSQIAMSATDARPSRFVGGERIDAAIAELNFEKRKVTLSIKLLEEIMNAKAIKEHSSPLSGKNLPFSSLSEQLDDKKNKKETE